LIIIDALEVNLLPFLKQNARQTGVIMQERNSDEQSTSDAGMTAAARDLHDALQTNDIKGIAAALKAAYELCESGSSDEDQKTPEPHSYDAQKED